MNSKKLWHSFALLTIYLFIVAFGAYAFARFSTLCHAPWGIPFAFGVAIWIFAIVCLILREKADVFKTLCLPCTAFSCALWVAAYIVGKELTLSLSALLLFSALVSACYLLLMALLSIPTLSEYLWYQIVAFLVWLTVSVLVLVFLAGVWLELFGLQLPEGWFFVTVFSILLGFLAFGGMLDAENFAELWQFTAVPMLVATGAVGLIVLLALAGGDSCDCGCDDCGCGGEGGGKRKATKRYSNATETTYENLSKGL